MEQGATGRDGFAQERRAAERLFHRDLPGGGYVSIELMAADRIVRVIVERRANRSRRQGHRPPVILEEAWEAERGFGPAIETQRRHPRHRRFQQRLIGRHVVRTIGHYVRQNSKELI